MAESITCTIPDRDRWTRLALFVAGTLLVATALLGYFAPWGYVGFSLMITAFLGCCPACRLLGIDRE
jgi:hypothetical protein